MLELTTEQRRISTTAGSALLIAGPGAGKTRTLAARAAFLVSSRAYRADQVLALTYTASMAERLRAEIEASLPESVACPACSGKGITSEGFVCGDCHGNGRIESAAPLVGTMHAIAARLTRSALKDELAGREEILALGWIRSERFGIAIPEDVDDLVSAAHKHAKRRKVGKRDLRRGLRLSGEALEGWPTEAAARQELARRELLAYPDLLVCLEALAGASSKIGADGEKIPSLREVFPCLLVDEAQDLTPKHWRIVDLWNPRELFAAGDDGQEIFGFLSRDEDEVDLPLSFSERVARAGGEIRVEGLGASFRSGPELCAFADALRSEIASTSGACSTLKITSEVEDSDRVFWPISVYRGAERDDGGLEAAASAVGELLLDGFAPEEIGVLARSWVELEDVGALLEDRGIAVALPKKGRDRWKTIAGRAFLALARHSEVGLLDEIGARSILQAIGIGAPVKVAERCMYSALSRGQSLAEALDEDRDASLLTPPGWWASSASAQSLAELEEVARAVESAAGPALVEAALEASAWRGSGWAPGDWLIWLASPDTSEPTFEEGRIALTTIHGAKGLEWSAVVLLGAVEGSFPGPRDKGEKGEAEAARVLYVGATRAREALRLIADFTLRGKPRDLPRWIVSADFTLPVEESGYEGDH